ncbi:MAG: riboflavin biosynthesis protein RibF, partial [Bacteroidales bacterium]|nr:riboflavin biosynthesis protein RibF [Bacteroidales bacterium]
MSHIATIGFFDGVHVGHQYVFSHLQKEAKLRQLSPLIITFSQHPREVLQDGYVPELLTDITERKALLEQYAPTMVFDFK